MKLKITLAVLATAALVVGGVIAVRYTQDVSRSLTELAPAGDKLTLRFVKNPAPVPDLTLKTIDGKTISSRDWKGKVTIINFWATWCPPCRAEIPDLIKLQDQYRDHLQIIGVSTDEAPVSVVAEFAAEFKMNYPIVMATPEIHRAFPGVFALPTSFIVDPELRTVQKHVGFVSPKLVEQETRVLAKLDANAEIELVEDTGQVLLSNAAQATSIPGLDLTVLKPGQKTVALKRLNTDTCTCGCTLTVAQCRINDPNCPISPDLAKKIVEEVKSSN
jgi:thiol-disulfide isomerase/thioredoxin